MKLVKTLCLAIALGGAGSLQAQTCSGGSDGGMDATGNQCNAPRDVGGAGARRRITGCSRIPKAIFEPIVHFCLVTHTTAECRDL